MEKILEDVIELMQKIERELKNASKPSYFGSLSTIGVEINTKENLLELIQNAFDELLPLLYTIKDKQPVLDLDKVILDIWDLKEKTKNLFDKSESTVLTKAGEYRNQIANIICLFEFKIAELR
ncbi:MAG: hypothetical protein K0R18_2015 [Bacillales bacterium]|jgi:hypothetical protein|nr:hypothetical protein [Bacillales bacterium]